MIEILESRYLYDATFHPKTGVLNVEGTRDGDTILLSEPLDSDTGAVHLDVSVNGSLQTFDAKKVKAIKVNGGSGPDLINAESVFIQTTLDGGAGDDTLIGGAAPDKLVGGGGSNSLSGGDGSDLLVAGVQADTIDGQDGNDRFIPDNIETADDFISGGTGFDVVDYRESKIAVVALVGGSPRPNQANDLIASDVEQIYGSEFDDSITAATSRPLQIFGEGGDDTLQGGSGDDTLDGGSGRDSMLGFGGRDHFRSKDGKVDTLDGGSRLDILENADTVLVRDSISNIPLL